MEIYYSQDKNVVKYIHNDGTETCLKKESSCNNSVDKETRNIIIGTKNRYKYSIFISVSYGCFLKCKFCYLTGKKIPFYKIKFKDIENNVIQAIEHFVTVFPEMKQYYAKICWMGMGDALPFSKDLAIATLNISNWIVKNKFAVGIDGVDLSTAGPKTNDSWIVNFENLNNELQKFKSNPYNENIFMQRSRFRLFYSLHSTNQNIRNILIPNTQKIDTFIPKLSIASKKYNIIFHQLFFDNINDKKEDIDNLIFFIRNNNYELRLLRFNKCPFVELSESKKFNEIACTLSKNVDFIKIQISSGSEIKSACGQFLLTNMQML